MSTLGIYFIWLSLQTSSLFVFFKISWTYYNYLLGMVSLKKLWGGNITTLYYLSKMLFSIIFSWLVHLEEPFKSIQKDTPF